MGFLGGGVKIFGGNPTRNAMTADLRRFVKKKYGDAPNSLVCTLGKEITKKRNVYALRREGYISPLCSANPPKPLVTPWCMWGPMVDVITHALFQLNRFRG